MISLRDVVTGFGNRDPLAEVWRRDLRSGGSSAEITGTLPLSFSSRGKPLTDYLISGNTIQDGTPTPESPVDVVGCGVRTTQLIPEIVQGGVSTSDGFLSNSSSRVRTNYIPVESGKTYAVSSGNQYLATGCYYNNGVFIGKINEVVAVTTSATFTVPKNVNQIAIGFRHADDTGNITPSDLQSYMLNEGSTALTYEPYGYKLPLTVNGTEYPIYLGQVPTTRRIKKLVLTGDENWNLGQNFTYYDVNITDYLRSSGIPISICSHYKSQAPVLGAAFVSDRSLAFYKTAEYSRIYIRDTLLTTVAAFKQWLAAQYAAGTPVTVWYVLAEPETGIVNEPLHKIGDYGDTISFAQAGMTIPTASGTNVLDMTSAVKPSEVYIKGKGIKPTGYGQLVDNNGVRILDKNNVRILVHGQ